MPTRKKGPTKLIIQRDGGTGSMDDIRDVDRKLDAMTAADEIPEGVTAALDFRETSVVITVQSEDRQKAIDFADKLAKDDRHRFFVSADNYKYPWEKKK